VLSTKIEERDGVEVDNCATLNGHLAIFDFDICHPCTWATRVTSYWHRLNLGNTFAFSFF
jgi:hypothetical protein